MAKTAAQIGAEIKDILSEKDEFRVEITDRSRPSATLRRGSYVDALRAAKDELLGSGGDRAEIYWRATKVAEGYLQSRGVGRGGGQKWSVKFVGEKPAKKRS